MLKAVPDKTNELIVILRLPDGVDSVRDLLEIIKNIPNEDKNTLIDRIYTLFATPLITGKRPPALCEYLSSFKKIKENRRLFIINIFNDLLSLSRFYKIEEFNDCCQFLNDCPVEEIRSLCEQTKLFFDKLNHRESIFTPLAALLFIRAIPEEIRNNFINEVSALLQNYNSIHRINLSVLFHYFRFPNENEMTSPNNHLLYLLGELSAEQQVNLILAQNSSLVQEVSQIPSFVEGVDNSELTNAAKLQILLFIYNRVTQVERSDFIQHLRNLRVPNRQEHLEHLLRLPANERADWVAAINLQFIELGRNQAMNSGNNILTVDLEDFSDNKRNPTRPLIDLFNKIDQKQQFPRIKYEGSNGADEGGLTRDFVSKMFQVLCHPGQKSLPFMEAEGRYLPKVEVGSPLALPLDDQTKCYKAIGMLFARAINGDPSLKKGNDSVTTGTHFHPNMFAMIHALTPVEMNRIPDPLVDDSVPDIKLKLTKFYLKTRFPQLFSPIGIEEAIVDVEIDQLMKGEVSPRLQDSYINKDFLKDYYVNSIIQATLIIAKSMHKTLNLPDQWERIKGNSPETLSNKIEGSLTPDLAIDAFDLKDEAEDTRRGMVKRWIREASPEDLKNFVYSLTGSTSLAPRQKLRVELCEVLNNHENAPVFHTCGQYMDLPKYASYEIFKAKLEISIASAIHGGFQLA